MIYRHIILPFELQELSFNGRRIFFIHNLKIYNITKHIYINDTIGSMIGMAALTNTDTKGYTKFLVPSQIGEIR